MTASKIVLNAASGVGGDPLNVENVFSTYLYDGTGAVQTITNDINLGDNLSGPYTEIADPTASSVGGYLYRNSDLSGNADGKTLTFSGWAYNTGGNFWLYKTQPSQDTGTRFAAIMSNGLFKVEGYNSSNAKILDTGWRTVTLNNWYHFLISVDLSSTSNRYLYINDAQELGPSSSWTTYTNDSIDFTNSHHYVNAYRSSANNGVDAGGGLAQIYLDYTYRDLSVVSNRRTFVTANTAPAGNLSSLNPILYLPFDATNSTGSNLGTGGNFVAYNTSYFEAKETGGPGYDAGSGEGGLVWVKGRSGTAGDSAWGGDIAHNLFDSSAPQQPMNSAKTDARTNFGAAGVNFTSTGFTVGYNGFNDLNYSTFPYVSWTFRKAKKFFDVVTWTGDGVAGREISHDLGSAPGTMIIKKTSAAEQWAVYHRSEGNTKYGMLDQTAAFSAFSGAWNNTTPTDTVFTVGNWAKVNQSGQTYVAYLFAHNDGDGDFGPTGDQDIIKCGSYTGTGATGNNVNLGFEPQWLMIKRTDSTGNWQIADVMRGMPNNGGAGAYQRLSANLSDAEVNGQEGPIPTSTGFVLNSTSTDTNGNGNTYIYIAIRRPTAVPETATDVFAIDTSVNASFPRFTSNFPVDFAISTTTNAGDPRAASSRLTSGKWMRTNGTNAESTNSAYVFDSNDGYFDSTLTNGLAWMWKRAPNFCDVVAYTGNGTAGRTVSHNLGVAPEMMWVKRTNSSTDWRVYHKDIGNTHNLQLNTTAAKEDALYWNDTTPTNTVFTLNNFGDVNGSGQNYISYLFTSLDGISKVGSVTQSGTTNVDCGFTSGARFVLLKRTDASGDWYIWDSTRGIVSGNDPYLLLNSTAAQVAVQDYINPLPSGFTITSNFDFGDYIFYAIA